MMNFEQYDFDKIMNKWTHERDEINRQNGYKPKLIDCGELVEINGEYVPAGME